MKELEVKIFTSVNGLPQLPGNSFFQSAELMAIYEDTPRMYPYMAVAKDNSDRVVANLMAVVRHRHTWFPPFFFATCNIIGNGDYLEGVENKEQIFGDMLKAITKALLSKVLFIEVANLTTKMFAYKEFRSLHFFPVHWMSIHNSLHSQTPEKRIGERAKNHIEHAKRRGAIIAQAKTDADIDDVIKLLKRHNKMKPKRYMPDNRFFRLLLERGYGKALVTRYRNKVIGCSITVSSEGDAYLWYAAFRRKSYALLHPDFVTIWGVLKSAQANGHAHVRFMDVGLPFRNNPFREFILSFGGKPVSNYRWFRSSWKWLNSILSWIYRN